MKQMIEMIKNIFLACACLFFSLILAECIVRLFLPQHLTHQRENRYTVVENFLNWSGRNHTSEFNVPLSFNWKGIRGKEIAYEKPDHTKRVLFLGDSYVEGAQVDLKDHFATRVQQTLDNALNGKVQIINYGTSAWEPIQELIYLKNEGYKFSPDFMYLFVFPTNDVPGNYDRIYLENLGQYIDRTNLDLLYRARERVPFLLRIKEYLLSHSHLVTLIKTALKLPQIEKHIQTFERQIGLVNTPSRRGSGQTLPEKSIEMWPLFQRIIKQIHSECKNSKIALKAVVIPCEPNTMVRGIGPDGYERTLNILKNEQMPVLDLKMLMENEKGPSTYQEFYFKKDMHWTPQGHQFVAQIIANDILKSLADGN